MKKYLTSSVSGFATTLAQAPVVSAAFGRGLGFVLMMTALLGVVALSVAVVLVLVRGMAALTLG
jgi:hypothetical protein